MQLSCNVRRMFDVFDTESVLPWAKSSSSVVVRNISSKETQRQVDPDKFLSGIRITMSISLR